MALFGRKKRKRPLPPAPTTPTGIPLAAPPPSRIHEIPLEQASTLVQWEQTQGAPPDAYRPPIVAQRGAQRGGSSDYEQYDIGNARFANQLRRDFDLTGPSRFALASEIVPVLTLDASDLAIPFIYFGEAPAEAAAFARISVRAVVNAITINAIEMLTGTRIGIHLDAGEDFGTSRGVLNLAPSLGGVTARGMLSGNGGVAPAGAILLANLDPQGSPGMRREFFPAPIVLAPGERLILSAQGINVGFSARFYGSELP